MRWFRRIAISILLILAAPFVGLGGYLAWGYLIDNPHYAETYFAGMLPVQEVLGSRKWHQGAHPDGGYSFGCTYAIVRLTDDAPEFPNVRHSRDWQMIWGGDWRPTPTKPGFASDNILERCAYLWPRELADELELVRDTPGAFAALRSFETLFLYAPEQRLAAVVRYGD